MESSGAGAGGGAGAGAGAGGGRSVAGQSGVLLPDVMGTQDSDKIPVTIITGFLGRCCLGTVGGGGTKAHLRLASSLAGAGKTTLLKHVLGLASKLRVAVIENEVAWCAKQRRVARL